MSTMYDIDNWLVSSGRVLRQYIADSLGDLVTVELNFPDTTELLPLPKTLVHLEVDDISHPVIGFGIQGVEDLDEVAGTWRLQEVAQHVVNYDIGVWASRESGGATHRAQVMQTLSQLFTLPASRQAFRDATGMSVVSFSGGRNELDRISDVPVWRALDMTLEIRVVSRFVPVTVEIVPTNATQDQQLTITDDTGGQAPVTP